MSNNAIGATTRAVSEVNQTRLVQALQEKGPMTVQQLRTETGLSLATIHRSLERLRSDRLVVDAGMAG
ncbi:MAG: winged helix-turn-helix domain-containing protein, partial [Nocardioidaceae bacterium]